MGFFYAVLKHLPVVEWLDTGGLGITTPYQARSKSSISRAKKHLCRHGRIFPDWLYGALHWILADLILDPKSDEDMVGPYTGPMGGTTCDLSCRDPMIGVGASKTSDRSFMGYIRYKFEDIGFEVQRASFKV